MSVGLPDPPANAGKWIDIATTIVARGLIPILLLGFVVWWDARREDKNNAQHAETIKMMREDLVESRKEVSRLLDKVIAMSQTQATEVKAAVKSVQAEVRATGDAVKAAAQPAAPPAPTPP